MKLLNTGLPASRPDEPEPSPRRPTSFAVRVAIQSLNAEGSISRAQVRGDIERIAASCEECYKRMASRAGRAPASTLDVALVIDEAGWAQQVRVQGDDLPGLDSCVRAALGKLRSRHPPDVGRVRVSFQIAFRPRAQPGQ